MLSIDLPVPEDVNLYLQGIGDIKDPSSRQFHSALQAVLTPLEINGAAGFYGRVSDVNHIIYETVPSPGVALLKIRADMQQGPDILPDWDLPEELRPNDHNATLPTANLLGWSRRERLSEDQLRALNEAGIDEDTFNVRNVAGIGINLPLLKHVAGQIENSKCKAIALFPTSTQGSLSQIPYSTRCSTDVEIQPWINIASKQIMVKSITHHIVLPHSRHSLDSVPHCYGTCSYMG